MEVSFRGFVKDLQQKLNGDNYVNKPHTVISFAMTPPMKQEIFHQLIDEIALQGHFANIGIKTIKKEEKKQIQKIVDESKLEKCGVCGGKKEHNQIVCDGCHKK